MARDADALRIRKWAGSADANVQTPEAAGLTRATGWPASYSAAGSTGPQRRVFNQLFRELTGLAVELSTRGLLEWDTSISYAHPAFVVGSDDRIYRTQQSNSGNDPVSDTAFTYWVPLINTSDGTVDAASETKAGVVELATADETIAGSDATRAVTPAGIAARTATTERTGIVELATTGEARTGTDTTRALTAAGLKAVVDAIPDAPAASESQAGVIELATQAEVNAGTDDERAVTAATLKTRFDALSTTPPPDASATVRGIIELATNAETQAGTDTERAVTPAGLASRTATTGRAGIVELATDAEVTTGTDTTRAVTVKQLRDRLNL